MQQRVLVPSGTWSEMQRRFEAVGQTAELAAKASQAGGASKADPKAEAALRLARSWADALPPGDDLPVQVPAVTPIPGGGAGSGRQDEAPAPLGVVSDSQAEAQFAVDGDATQAHEGTKTAPHETRAEGGGGGEGIDDRTRAFLLELGFPLPDGPVVAPGPLGPHQA